MTFISNSGATLAFTAGSMAVVVAGTNPILEGVIAGDLAVHPNGALPIAARAADGLTLVLPAPTTATVPFNVMFGPARSLVAQATQLTRDVYGQLAAWADRGLVVPVIAQQNAPPTTPADGDRYLIGTSPTGAWATRGNLIATWSAAVSQWLYTTPSAGWSAAIIGGFTRLHYSGAAWGAAAAVVIATTVGRLARFTDTAGGMGQSVVGIDGSGNVTGVGTLTANGQIATETSVAGDLWNRVRNTNTGAVTRSGFLFGNDANAAFGALFVNSSTNTGKAGINSLNVGTFGAYDLGFFTSDIHRGGIAANGTWNLLGNVGIGTASAAYRLHVYRDTQVDLYLQRGTAANITEVMSAPAIDGLLASVYSRASDFVGIADFYVNGATRGANNGAYRFFGRTDANFGPNVQIDSGGMAISNIAGAITSGWTSGGLTVFSTGTGLDTYNYGNTSNIRQTRFNGTVASPTAVASGERLGAFNFRGFNGGTITVDAQFAVDVDATVSSGITPTRMQWSTRDAAGTFAERMRLTNGGHLGLATTSPNKSGLQRALTLNVPNATDFVGLELCTADVLRMAFFGNLGGCFLRTATATPMIIGANNQNDVYVNNGIGIRTAGNPGSALDVNGDVAFRQAALTLANGANQNVSRPAFSSLRISGPTGAFSVGGLTGGADGIEVELINTTSQAMTINNEDASSTAGNRITTDTGANIACKIARLRYDATAARWRVMSFRT